MKSIYISIVSLWLCVFSININAQYITNGNAVDNGGGEFRLTQNLASQIGTVYHQIRLNLKQSFEIHAELNLGTNDFGADGIAFVLQPLSVNEIGVGGGGFGYYGITPSLAVEFDTYWNPDRDDPFDDHIAILKNGDIEHLSSNNLSGPQTLINIEDGQFHEVVFSWSASTQTFTVSYLNNSVSYTGDIVNTIFDGSPFVYWGFATATGSYANEQIVRIGQTSFIGEDITCGKSYDKILICHNGNTLCIGIDGMTDHLNHGDIPGNCVATTSARISINTAAKKPVTSEVMMQGIKTFPNPATHYLEVQWSTKTMEQTSITVTDIQGRLVKKFTPSLSQPGVNKQRISFEGLAKGTYLLQVQTASGKQLSKFVVQ